MISTKEFQHQYEELNNIRLRFQRSFKKYEILLQNYSMYLMKYQAILQRVHDFKEVYKHVRPLEAYLSPSLIFFSFFLYFTDITSPIEPGNRL